MAPPAVLLRSWLRLERRVQGFSPLDRLTVIYVACTTGILLAHIAGWRQERPTPVEAGWLLAANALLCVAVLVAPRARAVRKHSFLAEWYVPFVVSALYAAIGLLNGSPLVVDTSFDHVVQHWEFVVFGQQLAYTWGRVMPSVALSCEAGRPVRKMMAYPSCAACLTMSTIPGTGGNSWAVTKFPFVVELNAQLLAIS